ncbi:MAG TPA: methyltransferase domain-containing protein [Candidatus Dojkabacteria bacterium]|nr:methyltransferase domain-containing protein [Candidatus Dojkabacteria bacterium]
MTNDVTDYDLFDYDYREYWKARQYEDLAERNVLQKILKGESGKWFLDIGGSYGRLTSTYYKKYSNPIILDYSIKTLQKNRKNILSKYPNVELIAGNAYKMPFKQNTFDGAMMVRVLHHIENIPEYFEEVHKVMNGNAIYIQEIPNKIHIKASLKAIAHLNFKFFNQTPYEHPLSEHNAQGTAQGLKGIFYNYHPKDIQKKLETAGFSIEKRYGCSFLRIPLLKKFLNPSTMIFFEKLLQNSLSWTNIPPSIFLVCRTKNTPQLDSPLKLEDVLVCPKCKGDLDFSSKSKAICKKCSTVYTKKEDIWDFRTM